MKKLLFLGLMFCMSLNAQDYYIHAGKLFDAENGKMLNNMTIIVSGDKIKQLKKGFINPKIN